LGLLLILLITLISCETDTINDDSIYLVECPPEIVEKALLYAIEYSQVETEYEYGGQDYLRSIKIDCSGLIVNCYNYALKGTDYILPFQDSAVINFYQKLTIKTDNPRPGDLIFMGEDRDYPTHMSIFVRKENDCIYFIDSTYKPEDGVDGVSERYYHENDSRFLSLGILLVGKNQD
jgi:hypothetical protein